MVNCLFYSIFFTMFLNISLGSLRFSQINRSFLSMYKGMLEACIRTVDSSGEPITPYFNKSKIESYVISYLDKSIGRYSSNYTLTTKYYDESFLVETSSYIRGISIKLDAKINMLYHYEKEQRFTVETRELL